MKTEVWSALTDFKGYYVSRSGRIKRVVFKGEYLHEVYLKSRLVSGYQAYTLVNSKGKKRTVYAHKAIAQCFVRKPKNQDKLRVVHLDGKRLNNAVDNLKWMSAQAFMHREFSSGKRNNAWLWKKRVKKYGVRGSHKISGRKSPLSNEEQNHLVSQYSTGNFTMNELAGQFGCSVSHVSNLVRKAKLNEG